MQVSSKNPKISVLMSVYNGRQFLKEAIESILNQSFTDFEFIIINDGSIDDSGKIITKYHDKRIKYLENAKNIGMSKSLNTGIGCAKGKYIARMDCDDISLKDRLLLQYRYMEQHTDIDVLSSWIYYMNEAGKILGIQNDRHGKYLFFNMIFFCYIPHPTVFIKKSVLTKEGGYNEKAEYGEDYELWSRLIRKYKFTKLDKPLLKYRFSGNSISSTKKESLYQYTRSIAKENIKYFSGLFVKDSFLDYYRNRYTNMPFKETINCINTLRFVYKNFRKKDNPNYDRRNFKSAYKQKRKIILKNVYLRFSFNEKLLIFIKTISISEFFTIFLLPYFKKR